MSSLTCGFIGTDTGIGKSWVAGLVVRGLRRMGRRVWVHKPVACGGWNNGLAEDGRWWQDLVGDDQPLRTICPRQYPEACAPHLAAQAAGVTFSLAELALDLERARPRDDADFIIEGVGGLLVPMTSDRETLADLLMVAEVPVVIVARPHLGTLNHTALTVEVARARGLAILGIIVNDHEPIVDSIATRTVDEELRQLTHTPILGHLRYGETDKPELIQALLASI